MGRIDPTGAISLPILKSRDGDQIVPEEPQKTERQDCRNQYDERVLHHLRMAIAMNIKGLHDRSLREGIRHTHLYMLPELVSALGKFPSPIWPEMSQQSHSPGIWQRDKAR
jgi:hypothetical protein